MYHSKKESSLLTYLQEENYSISPIGIPLFKLAFDNETFQENVEDEWPLKDLFKQLLYDRNFPIEDS